MAEILYPTLEEVLQVHRDIAEAYGDDPSVFDRGLVQSALMRPQMGYYDDIFQEAAALLQSLATNHGFVDANKRTAFIVADGFLKANGYRTDIDNREVKRFVLHSVVLEHASVEDIAAWLEDHTT